jgi:hypothetical protein
LQSLVSSSAISIDLRKLLMTPERTEASSGRVAAKTKLNSFLDKLRPSLPKQALEQNRHAMARARPQAMRIAALAFYPRPTSCFATCPSAKVIQRQSSPNS